MVTAAVPAQILPKSKLSNEFLIEVLAQKYQQHLPVYRQCATLASDHGIEISRKALTHGLLAASELLGAAVQTHAAELPAGGEPHAVGRRGDIHRESAPEKAAQNALQRAGPGWGISYEGGPGRSDGPGRPGALDPGF